MRLKIFYLIVLGFSPAISQACDFCNAYLGLDPGYNKNTISLRSNYRMTSTEMQGLPVMKVMHGEDSNGSSEEGGKLEGSFWTMELFAKIYPTSKIMLVANLPYHVNMLHYGNDEESRGAIGDMTLMGFYQLASTMTTDTNKVKHRLFGGIGVKLPTGKSSGASDVNIPMSHELYSGTGSTDYLAAISYIGKVRKLGWNLDVSFKYNTESKNDYQYGHTFNVTPRLFYETKIKSLSILPHIGAAYENGAHDFYDKTELENSGGNTFWGSAGVDVYFSRFSISTDVRVPMSQNLNGENLEDKYWLFGSFNIHF